MLKARALLCAALFAVTIATPTATMADGGLLEQLHEMVCSWMMGQDDGHCGGIEP